MLKNVPKCVGVLLLLGASGILGQDYEDDYYYYGEPSPLIAQKCCEEGEVR